MIGATNSIRLQRCQIREVGFHCPNYSVDTITSTDAYYFKHPILQYVGKVVFINHWVGWTTGLLYLLFFCATQNAKYTRSYTQTTFSHPHKESGLREDRPQLSTFVHLQTCIVYQWMKYMYKERRLPHTTRRDTRHSLSIYLILIVWNKVSDACTVVLCNSG